MKHVLFHGVPWGAVLFYISVLFCDVLFIVLCFHVVGLLFCVGCSVVLCSAFCVSFALSCVVLRYDMWCYVTGGALFCSDVLLVPGYCCCDVRCYLCFVFCVL